MSTNESTSQTEITTQQKETLRILLVVAALLFTGWGLTVSYIDPNFRDILPGRLAISLFILSVGLVSRRFNLSLRGYEYLIVLVGVVALTFAHFLPWYTPVNLIWVAGCSVIITGVLNFLTHKDTALTFCVSVMALATVTLIYPIQDVEPRLIWFQYLTSCILGYYSSYQRYRFLMKIVESARLQNTILNNMSEGVMLLSGENIVSSNAAACEILGLTREQLHNKAARHAHWKYFSESGEPLESKDTAPALARAQNRPIIDQTIRLQRRENESVWITVSATPVHDQNGIDAILITMIDVTAARAAQETIESQRVSMLALRQFKALGEMSAGIAHEINNPLTIVNLQAHQIREAVLRGDASNELLLNGTEKIQKTVMRISKIIDSMRALSRNSSLDTFQTTSLRSIMEEILDITRDSLAQANIHIKVQIPAEVIFECHRGLISQVLLNLISNAKDAICDLSERWIEISAQFAGTSVEIVVTDSGKGIPLNIHDKIMNPFFTTKETGKGTGLGLSLVQSIVQNHGGTISIDRQAANTRFVILLPTHQIHARDKTKNLRQAS